MNKISNKRNENKKLHTPPFSTCKMFCTPPAALKAVTYRHFPEEIEPNQREIIEHKSNNFQSNSIINSKLVKISPRD